jgi:hypothetical protein
METETLLAPVTAATAKETPSAPARRNTDTTELPAIPFGPV